MKREIKFRAWLKEQKAWAEGYIIWPDGKIEFPQGGWDCGGHDDSEMLEIMQYTGLKDKNGKEIYEGDIVKYDNAITAKVIFHDGGFCGYDGSATSSDEAYTRLSPDPSPFDYDFELEVIGNIHQNPELL